MTATSPVGSPASSSSGSAQSSPVCLPAWRRHLRTTLPLRSAPGVWLLLGVTVVMVGMGVAVAGYVSAAPKPAGGRGSTHVERMKLAGPVVMGVGLFIFICAATLLYENRDRRVVRLETHDDLEHLKGGDSQGSWAAPVHTANQNRVAAPPPVPHTHSDHFTPPPQCHAGGSEEEEEEEEETQGRSTLLARVLYHQEPTSSPCRSSSPSSVHSNAWTTTAEH